MSQQVILKVDGREPDSKRGNRRLRREGILPGSISIRGEDAVSLAIRRDELQRALSKSGMSAVFNLQLDDKDSYTVMVKELQSAPITGELLHVTFQQVSLTEETRAEVAIRAEGKPSLEHKRLEYLQHLDYLPVRGLPQNIPNSIDIEVGDMEAGDNVLVSDLEMPEGVETDMDLDRLVFTVSLPRLEVEEEVEEDEDALAEGEDAEGDEEAEETEEEN